MASTVEVKSRGQIGELLSHVEQFWQQRQLREMLFVRMEGILLNCTRRRGQSLKGSSVSRSCVGWKLFCLSRAQRRMCAGGGGFVFKLK